MDVKFTTIRLSKELHSWLKDKARRERRSMNSEAIFLLEQAKKADEAEVREETQSE